MQMIGAVQNLLNNLVPQGISMQGAESLFMAYYQKYYLNSGCVDDETASPRCYSKQKAQKRTS